MKKLIVLIISLMFIMGCATMGAGPSSDMQEMKQELAELKQEVERMRIMGAAGGAAANFYPFRGGLDSTASAGELQDLAGTATQDVGIFVGQGYTGTADEGDWYEAAGVSLGNVYGMWVLNASGSCAADDWPENGASNDGTPECWEYAGAYTSQTEFIPAHWMDTTGETDPTKETYSTAANSREYKVYSFANAADSSVTFQWHVPPDLVGGRVKFRWYGIVEQATGPSAENIAFEIECISLGDGDEGGPAWSSATEFEESGITQDQDDIIISAWVEHTLSGLAAGEVALCHLLRDVSDDTYEQDFSIIGVDVRYKSVQIATY